MGICMEEVLFSYLNFALTKVEILFITGGIFFAGFIRGFLFKSTDSGERVRRVEKSQKHVCITISHHNSQILGYFHTPYAVKKNPAGPSVLL